MHLKSMYIHNLLKTGKSWIRVHITSRILLSTPFRFLCMLSIFSLLRGGQKAGQTGQLASALHFKEVHSRCLCVCEWTGACYEPLRALWCCHLPCPPPSLCSWKKEPQREAGAIVCLRTAPSQPEASQGLNLESVREVWLKVKLHVCATASCCRRHHHHCSPGPQ